MKEKSITKLKILTEAKDVDSDFGAKLECKVSYDGMKKDSPDNWSLNKKSRNALIDHFGPDTKDWIGFTIPIETAITEKGRAIYVDIVELQKSKKGMLM